MRRTFALAAHLERWLPTVRYDLASSDSETMSLPALLALAGPEDLRRWQSLGFGYLDPRGAHWLREAIAARYERLAAHDVLCCAGAQEALACLVASMLSPQDHAIVILPIYQPSEEAVTSICSATGIALQEQGKWWLDVDRVAAALRPNTKMILMNVPNSPTGAILDEATLAALVALCRTRGLWLVNDEVYQHTASHPRQSPPNVADLYERGVSINSLSKGFGLAGLRVGWIATRDRSLLDAAVDEKNRMSSCVSALSEVLAHVALRAEPGILAAARTIGESNRRLLEALVGGHPDLFEADLSQNLAFAFLRHRGGAADGFALSLAREAKVLVLPSSLWRSRLASVPLDRLRIGLGRVEAGRAFERMDEYLRLEVRRLKVAR